MLVSHCNMIYDNLICKYRKALSFSRHIKLRFIPSIFSPCVMSETPFGRSTPKQFFIFSFDEDFVYVRIRDKNCYCYFKAPIKDIYKFEVKKNDKKN